MLEVTKFVVRSFDLDHLDLFWEIADFTDRTDVITAYEFYVLRSESPGGPFDTLAGPFEDQYSFRDTEPNLLHKWRRLYYKLKLVEKSTLDELLTDAASLTAEPDLIALEIHRQEDVLLREFIGRRCWLFPVRTFGARCFCFDGTLQRRTRSNCPTCFDTGYLGGYLAPIECYIQLDPNPDSSSNTTVQGEKQPKNTSARLIAYPPVKPKDILIEAENKRWEVVTVNRTERLRSIVHQELTLHMVPVGDVQYKLPVNLDSLEDQRFAAERNFTNPQHTGDQGPRPAAVREPEEDMQTNKEQSFQYTVLSDGDSFIVTIPVAMKDISYVVTTTISTVPAGGALAQLVALNTGRTTAQFTLEASGNLTAGTIIDIIVRDRE